MANIQTTIDRVEFIIEKELTHCNVLYSSSEPGALGWGGGWKTKTFPASKSAIDILKEDLSEYILWSDGREGVNED